MGKTLFKGTWFPGIHTSDGKQMFFINPTHEKDALNRHYA
jgi:hypothetical protein